MSVIAAYYYNEGKRIREIAIKRLQAPVLPVRGVGIASSGVWAHHARRKQVPIP